MTAPIYRDCPHSYRLDRCTIPGKLHTREKRIAITPRGSVILSRALHIAINELTRKVQDGSNWPKQTLQDMEGMLASGIFINNDDGEQKDEMHRIYS